MTRIARRLLHTSEHHDGDKPFTHEGGRRVMTPMLLVMTATDGTDILFALDSVPVIFGLMQGAFIVFTATAFSLLGLRQLYFLIDGLLDRLVHLTYGLAVIPAFIGVELVLHALHENDVPFTNGGQHVEVLEISTGRSRSVILGVLVVTVVASLVSPGGRVQHAVSNARRHATQYVDTDVETDPGLRDLADERLTSKEASTRGCRPSTVPPSARRSWCGSSSRRTPRTTRACSSGAEQPGSAARGARHEAGGRRQKAGGTASRAPVPGAAEEHDGRMGRPTTANPLLILAMDQRDSFAKLFGTEEDEATPEQVEQMRAAKTLIYRGVAAVAGSVEDAQVGVLTDEEYGPAVLAQAKADGRVLAYPVEKSGQKLFDLEYGDQTPQHVERWDPDYVKVLVRMNPDDSDDDTGDQLGKLATLSQSLHGSGLPFLLELLVPASQTQLAAVDGDSTAYDRDVRPGLAVQVMESVQGAGVEPTLWKIEGLETAEAARTIVAGARAGGRDADCIVLGRDAPREKLDHWLQVAAGVDGFVGFAIGRSIWKEPLQRYLDDGDEATFLETVGQNYLHYVHTYLAAR